MSINKKDRSIYGNPPEQQKIYNQRRTINRLENENKQLKEKIANIEEVVSKPWYISDVELAGYIKRIIDGDNSNE